MKRNNNIIIGLSFLIYGALSLLNSYGAINTESRVIVGITFCFYGIATANQTFGNNERGRLVFASVVFLIGVVLLVKSHFELLESRGIVFTSILFIGGAALLILFLENLKEKVFLYTGAVLVLLGILSATFFRTFGLFTLANKIGNLFEYFWPVLLIVFGIGIFINRKK